MSVPAIDPAGWPQVTFYGTVYHATDVTSALNIVQNGIQQVTSQWGNAQIGAGFYTHISPESAKNYTAAPEVVLELEVNSCVGRQVPRADCNHLDGTVDYVTGNDFLTHDDDPLGELKFHNGDHLTLKRVGQGSDWFDPNYWLSLGN